MSWRWLLWAFWLGLPSATWADPGAPWVERDGTQLRVSVDVRPWFDARDTPAQRLREKLSSGLTTTLHFDLEVRDAGQVVRARYHRRARVRWHLWDERFTATLEEPGGGSSPHFASVGALVERLARFDAIPLSLNLANDETVHRVVLSLAINPVTAEESARMRQWLTGPQAQATLDPVSGTLLGSFVRFFDNLKPSVAEDRRTLEGPWFRGDRLPFYRAPGAVPPSVPSVVPTSAPASSPPSGSASAPSSTPGAPP
jgi:hypothetical protein